MTMVLKLDDKVKIEGESILKGYEKQIDVAYLDHGMSMPMVGDKSSNSRTSGRCAHKDLRCTMRLKDTKLPRFNGSGARTSAGKRFALNSCD